MSVELVHWNPRRPRFPSRLGGLVGGKVPVNNFGDLLGPLIVRRILELEGLEEAPGPPASRLLSVGSVIRLAREGDVIWGSGVNGKSLSENYDFKSLDVRAVRGPLTKRFLEDRSISVPEIFGDPGLLVSRLWTREELSIPKQSGVTIVPNLHDYKSAAHLPGVINPRTSVWDVVRAIASSELVVGSSLHGIVVADSFGVPARLVRSVMEPSFKYEDYYLGTGRSSFKIADDVATAISMGGDEKLDWDCAPLLESFPRDLWR